ncbi:sulfatase [Flavivirga sp. 57AJ16]|uniref:sulfatase n=1 Tax=Flavivirga sp. 57AJ16 TaxID=3025307 RepID=UPI002366D876|nr:sulfatase [Flavivirga sp. 57AJ16]MDD7887973.1 sulfatase [Flavivirga sp. 57AJ16]
MKKLRIISVVILGYIISVAMITKNEASVSNIEAPDHPNIIMISVDDLGYSDVGYMNYKAGILTPNIDEIAESGMQFTDAYAVAPVCSPTRASIMTGKYPASLKLTCHIPGNGIENYLEAKNDGTKLKEAYFENHLPLNEITIAEVLKTKGYATGYIGKWHLAGDGAVHTSDGIVNANYHPENQGFDVNIGGCAYGKPESYFSPYSNGTVTDGPQGEYLTNRLGDEAIKFIEQNKAQPFFLSFAPYTVHKPLQAPASDIENNNGNVYFAMIDNLDQNIGKIMDKLDELNLLESTIVIFYSDNGGLFENPPLKGIKGTLNEGGIRVPLLVSWPNNIKVGSTSCTPITSVDFFPTILDLVGVNPNTYNQLEGISFLPLLKGELSISERPIYWHFPHHRNEGLSMGAAIRKGKWKYIYEFEKEEEYLYNLEEDIAEQNNLVVTNPLKAEELSIQLQQWLKEVDAEMPELND